jgi:hypothetical protein
MIKVNNLILALRSRLSDIDYTKNKWSDEQLFDCINSSLSHIATEFLIFTDRIEVNLKSGVNRYKIPLNIINVISLNINNNPVEIKSLVWMQNNLNNLNTNQFYACFDEQSFYVYPLSNITDTTKIEMFFNYIPQIESIEDEIGVSILANDALIFYSLHMAYQVNTTEKNAIKSASYLNLFEEQMYKIKGTLVGNKQSKKIRSKFKKV